MSLFQHLSVLALRQSVDGASKVLGIGMGERAAESIMGFLTQHFTDHSHQLTAALEQASGNAWKALEIALAGESLWTWLDNADQKGFRQQVRDYLDSLAADSLQTHPEDFRQQCLAELRQAKKRGVLSGSLRMDLLARQIGEFARYGDPEQIMEAEWRTIEQMASLCHEASLPTLATYLRLRPLNGKNDALLIIAVRYFFRRQLEMNEQLYRGLSWCKLEALSAAQEHCFTQLHEALRSFGDRLETLFDSLHGLTSATHGVVLDIQSEVEKLARRFDLLHQELRPCDSLCIQDETERRLVKELVARYRTLPREQREAVPGLLNALGKLEVAAGAFDEAHRDFEQAALIATDAKLQAEAHFNCYSAALESGDVEAALEALKKAVELDADRYALFPMQKYEPERILGAGGFGVAYLCRNRLSGSRVVVKTLRGETIDRDVTEVFREAQILEQLDHPAIIRLRDCDYADRSRTRPYLVMDYFEGQTLQEFVETNGTLSHADLMGLLEPIVQALHAAHERDILHRDIKPGNLLVRRDENGGWHVKIIDFGLALRQKMLQTSTAASGTRTIKGSSIAGTLDYAAPEQLGKLPNVQPGPYTDVYGLAKTCCYALFKTTQPLRKHWRQIPEELADLLEQCLSESPQERLQGFGPVLETLSALRRQTPRSTTDASDEADEKLPGLVTETVTTATSRTMPAASGKHWWHAEAQKGIKDTLTPTFSLLGHTGAVLSFAFSHDGQRLISGSADHTVRIWDLPSRSEFRRLHGHTDAVTKVLYLPGDKLAITASKDKSVRIWDVVKGEEVKCFPARTNQSLTISHDGIYALTGNNTDGMIRLWEVKSGRELKRLKGHMGWVLSLDFSAKHRQLLSASADGTVRLWDVFSGRELRRMQGHRGQVNCVKFASAKKFTAISSGEDGTVRGWDLQNGKETMMARVLLEPVSALDCTNNQKCILSPYFSEHEKGGLVALWAVDEATNSANIKCRLVGHRGTITAIATSPDQVGVATGDSEGTIHLWSFPWAII